MHKRLAAILLATALALGVLWLTLRVGQGPARNATSINDAPIGDAALPPGFDPEHAGGSKPTQESVGSVEGYHYSKKNPKGQLIELFGRTLKPLPNGRSDVGMPGARVYLTDHRVLQITADRGTFDLPDNTPRGGEFHDNVVLTLFEAPVGKDVDLTEASPDVQVRVFLEDTTFDLELGQIQSDGPVHLTGPRVDFQGEGLSLSYNELRRRIDHLEIARGKELRFKPKAAQAGTQPATRPAQIAATGPTTSPADHEAGQPLQFYRAHFESDVKVRSKDLAIDADTLSIVFSLGTGKEREEYFKNTPNGGAAPATQPSGLLTPLPSTPAALLASLWLALVPQSPPTAPPEHTLAAPSVDDVTIAWRGKLIIEPQEEPPPEVSERRDIAVEMLGKPIAITTTREQTVHCGRLTYVSRGNVIRFEGTEATPLVIAAPALGELRGPALIIEQDKAVGQITGAGSLTAPTAQAQGLAGAVRAEETKDHAGLPPGFAVRWNDRVDLTFYTRAPSTTQDADKGLALRALRDASFRGGVGVEHPQFGLKSDLLSIGLTDPSSSGENQSIDAIHAVGSVAVNTKGDQKNPPLTMTSDQLAIAMTPDSQGRLQPSELVAKGNVVATQAQRVLKAGTVDATLEVGAAEAGGGAAGESKLAIKQVTAQDNVKITLADRGVTMASDKLVADGQSDQIELLGADAAPATLSRQDSSLAGARIVLGQKDQTVRVMGPGVFKFVSAQSTPAPGGDAAKHEGQLVTVTWKDAMRFDNVNGLTQFVGGVVCESVRGIDTSKLTTDDLRITLTPPPPPPPPEGPEVKVAATQAHGDVVSDFTAGGRSVKSADALGDTTFVAENWVDQINGKLATRLLLKGPKVHFDGAQQLIEVDQAGSMMVEDYRQDTAKAAEQPGSPIEGAHFAGRGATLFTWGGKMTLDLARNDMDLRDKVQMIHKPASADAAAGGDSVQLDCKHFLADLESTGGLGVWMSSTPGNPGSPGNPGYSGAGKTPQPRITSVKADDAVRVISGKRTITTDHLIYSGADQTVLLKAEPGRQTQMNEKDDPQTYSAEAFRWDLVKNRIEIDRPGAGRVPIK